MRSNVCNRSVINKIVTTLLYEKVIIPPKKSYWPFLPETHSKNLFTSNYNEHNMLRVSPRHYFNDIHFTS